MKFLHTADWQLGAKIGHAGERASAIRAKRFDAAEEVVSVSKAEGVDFVLIAGDLFEDHNVSDSVVHRAVRILDELDPTPVFVLPGNHDPLRAGGVWQRDAWALGGEHIRLLDSREPWEPAEGVVLFPCPTTQKQSTLDPTAELPSRQEDDSRIRIAVAHGALDDVPDTPNFPIDPERPELADLDYLALGDWHGTQVRERLAYPGTIEPSRFDESDPGNVLLVEIDGAGEAPELEKRRVGQLRWLSEDLRVRDASDVEGLEAELVEERNLSALVLRLDLQIAEDATLDACSGLDRLRDRLEREAFHLDWRLDESELLSSGQIDLPPGLVEQADRILAKILEGEIPDGPGRDYVGRDREVVREARGLLHQFAREEKE